MKPVATFTKLRKRYKVLAAAGLVLLSSVLTYGVVGLASGSSPTAAVVDHPVDKPFTFEVSRTIDASDLASNAISPSIKGEWRNEKDSSLVKNTVSFAPEKSFKANTTYTVHVPDTKSVLGNTTKHVPIVFTTQTAPGIQATGLATLADNSVIAADYKPTVTLDARSVGLRQLELRIASKTVANVKVEQDKEYQWKLDGYLPQGEIVTFEVYDVKQEETMLKRTLKVASHPGMKQPVKKADFTPADKAEIIFNEPMETAGRPVFDAPGKGEWLNSTTYSYKLNDVAPGKTYGYILPKGFRSKAGGIVERDEQYSFSTTGPVAAKVVPAQARGAKQSQQDIRVMFSASVDKPSAEARFKSSHGKVSGYRWEGNTMIATVHDLGYQNNVTVSLSAGVKNTSFGLPSSRVASGNFATEIRSKRLNVPFYRQEHSATCAVASLKMILAYRGVNTSEMSIVQKMGYKPTKLNKSTDPDTWDDPNQMFVGHVDGSLKAGSAAGPNAGPVAAAASAYGRRASVTYSSSPQWIAAQLYSGNPVVMFGAFRNSGFMSWKTPSGRIEKMNTSSHATAVVGVVGEPSRPLGFWVHDPLTGNPRYWSTGEVAADIAKDAYKQAVVVY